MAWPLKTYDDLIALINESEHDYDMPVIDRAYQLALTSHQDQKRLSGAPYISHPVAVACILVELGMDTESVAAGLLHDVVEDTPVNLEQIKKSFGPEIANLIDGVTKLGRIPYSSREEQQAENLRKMLIAMADDIRVIIIKLADRLHNMRTIEFMSPQKQRDKALENMEVYAPIAHRLGIRAVKEELEDLSLRCLDPVAYEEIENGLALRRNERKAFIDQTKKYIYERVSPLIPNVYLEGRVKSINGIFRKTFIQGRSMEEIYDIYAVRVIVDTVNDCYNVLGIIHDMYRPIPNRFKDYISTPKPNLYQSLHTTVIGKDGIPFEVQIRTWEMHHTAEYGIAAHWKYKSGENESREDIDLKLNWIAKLIDAEDDTRDPDEFLRALKIDILHDETFVFTPKGDIITLPLGATVIDFAYAIHSEVGNKMTGAKINGMIVPIDRIPQNGEIVEILTSATSKGPSRDWLKIVRTGEARTKIRQWFKKEKRTENIAVGKIELDREFKRYSRPCTEAQKAEILTNVAHRIGIQELDDLYNTVGYGGMPVAKLSPKLRDEFDRIVKPEETPITEAELIKTVAPLKPKRGGAGVIIDGVEGLAFKFAKCCNPLPGDNLIGFITKGYGVSIHKRDCPNVTGSVLNPDYAGRWVAAHWDGGVTDTNVFVAALCVFAEPDIRLLADITSALADMKVSLTGIGTRMIDDSQIAVNLTVACKNLDHLKSIQSRLRTVPHVDNVVRK